MEVSGAASHCTAPSLPTGGADFPPELGQGGAAGFAEDNGRLSPAPGGDQRGGLLGWLRAGNLGEEQGTRTEGPGAYCRDRLSVFISVPGLFLALPSVLPLRLGRPDTTGIPGFIVLRFTVCLTNVAFFIKRRQDRSPTPEKDYDLLYSGGLEPNPQYLGGMPVIK